jgi:hypothetical protein
VSLVLAGATTRVEPDKLSLYLDGRRVDRGPGVRIPCHHEAPMLGAVRHTTLHTGEIVGFISNGSKAGFRGRIAAFRQVNAAAPAASR